MRPHTYALQLTWTGNRGNGTTTYSSYSRDYDITADGRPVLPGSSDPSFRGDPARYNPEQFLVAAVSSCHMLSYLHLCAVSQVVVVSYVDDATGSMQLARDGSGRFLEVILNPTVTISAGDQQKALTLHHDAHEKCFIANSVNFPVNVHPTIQQAKAGD